MGVSDNIGSGASRRFRFICHGSPGTVGITLSMFEDATTADLNNKWTSSIHAPNFSSVNIVGSALNAYRADSTNGFIGTGDFTGIVGTPPEIQALYIFGTNENGAVTARTYNRISFVAIHGGLLGFQVERLYNLVQSMRGLLGGGYL